MNTTTTPTHFTAPTMRLKSGSFREQVFPYGSTPAVSCLSWKNPFAALMLFGKQETRTWNTNKRGWVLICASKVAYPFSKLFEIAGDRQLERISEVLDGDTRYMSLKDGYAIGIGRLTGSRPFTEQDEDACFVKYDKDSSLYVHEYTDVHPIKPLQWRGTQGFRSLTDREISLIQIL